LRKKDGTSRERERGSVMKVTGSVKKATRGTVITQSRDRKNGYR